MPSDQKEPKSVVESVPLDGGACLTFCTASPEEQEDIMAAIKGAYGEKGPQLIAVGGTVTAGSPVSVLDPVEFVRSYNDLLHEVEQLRERKAAGLKLYEALRAKVQAQPAECEKIVSLLQSECVRDNCEDTYRAYNDQGDCHVMSSCKIGHAIAALRRMKLE